MAGRFKTGAIVNKPKPAAPKVSLPTGFKLHPETTKHLLIRPFGK